MINFYRKAFYDYLAMEFGSDYMMARWSWNMIRSCWPHDEDSGVYLSRMCGVK